jgi:hypothetical protein
VAKPKTSDHKSPADTLCNGSRMIRISDEEDPKTKFGLITASCGWSKFHRRKKVREDAAEKHANTRHGGQAMWM